MNKKEFFKQRIDKIAKESFNNDQKEIAKKIIDKTDENDLDAVWGLISQRVKTGFVFDEAPEINHNCVAFIKENEKLGINLDNKNALEHALIIGENYDALKNLVAMYTDKQGKGLVDVIYIDPPYNTESSKNDGNDYKEEIEGKNKFIYRDKYTRDGWLNMMNERLKLAKKILSDDGVIFISIDDSEQAYLKILCDEIFGENLVEQYIWCLQDKTEGSFVKTPGLTVRKEHEYIIACFKSSGKKFKKYAGIREFSEGAFSNPDNDPRGPWFSGNISRNGITSTTGSKYYAITNPAGQVFKRNWTLSKEEYEEALKDNRIFFAKEGEGVPRLKIFANEPIEVIQSSLFTDVHTSITGKNELKKLFNGDSPFNFPKPPTLIKRLLTISSEKDALVLDFFAGSGTTGQAVMELNEEDGGNRKFILVTNNENNIAKDITRERLYRIIKGVGSKGEDFEWTYSKDKKNLDGNSLRVFDIVKQELNITETEKAEKIKDEVELNFVKLKSDYTKNSNMNIYNVLSSLTPYKDNGEE